MATLQGRKEYSLAMAILPSTKGDSMRNRSPKGILFVPFLPGAGTYAVVGHTGIIHFRGTYNECRDYIAAGGN